MEVESPLLFSEQTKDPRSHLLIFAEDSRSILKGIRNSSHAFLFCSNNTAAPTICSRQCVRCSTTRWNGEKTEKSSWNIHQNAHLAKHIRSAYPQKWNAYNTQFAWWAPRYFFQTWTDLHVKYSTQKVKFMYGRDVKSYFVLIVFYMAVSGLRYSKLDFA